MFLSQEEVYRNLSDISVRCCGHMQISYCGLLQVAGLLSQSSMESEHNGTVTHPESESSNSVLYVSGVVSRHTTMLNSFPI